MNPPCSVPGKIITVTGKAYWDVGHAPKDQSKIAARNRMKYWEVIANKLSKAGWSWGCASAVDFKGRPIWIADAHRDGKRFVVRADKELTAFMEPESAIYSCGAIVLDEQIWILQTRHR